MFQAHFLAKYNKALVAGAGLLAAIGDAVADGQVTSDEVGIVAAAAFVLLGVFGVRNAQV